MADQNRRHQCILCCHVFTLCAAPSDDILKFGIIMDVKATRAIRQAAAPKGEDPHISAHARPKWKK
jgi:hypothetical protein